MLTNRGWNRRSASATARLSALAVLLLTDCGGGGRPADLIAVQANITGLLGPGLVLQLNGGHDLPVGEDGRVTLAFLVQGSTYAVTVKTQPSDPPQICTVTNGVGTVGAITVTDIDVTCVRAYGIAGTVSGLVGSGLKLHSSLGEDVAVAAPGDGSAVPFAFPGHFVPGTSYVITIARQPSSPQQTCSVGRAEGVIASADVTDVTVVCSAKSFAVGGTVSGLASGTTVVLVNNGTDDLAISKDEAFTFAQPVADGATYQVSVKTQPVSPWQTCAVTNGAGTVSGADVSTVSISCTKDAGRFVAVGKDVVALSADGITWEHGTIPAGGYLGLAWNGAVLVAVGGRAGATSPDGVTWTSRSFCLTCDGAIASTAAGFVVVDVGSAYTSSDGMTWITEPLSGGVRHYAAAVWTGSVFTTVGLGFSATRDLSGWHFSDPLAGSLLGLAWNGTKFVAVGNANVATSADGLSWTFGSIPSGTYSGVAWNGSVFAAVGDSVAATSPDGLTWTSQTIPSGTYTDVGWSGSQFVAVGNSVVATSPNGVTWTARTIPAGSYASVVFARQQ